MNGEMVESGSECGARHPIWLVAEGYGLCVNLDKKWFAWRFTPPRIGGWIEYRIRSREGEWLIAWLGLSTYATKAAALAFIQADMDAYRALPFDEAAERARLVAVPR